MPLLLPLPALFLLLLLKLLRLLLPLPLPLPLLLLLQLLLSSFSCSALLPNTRDDRSPPTAAAPPRRSGLGSGGWVRTRA